MVFFLGVLQTKFRICSILISQPAVRPVSWEASFMQASFETAEELSGEVELIFRESPVLLYYELDSIAPFPGFQSHDGIEMYYIEQGQGRYLVGDHAYPLQEGTLMMIQPFTLHKVMQTDMNRMLRRNVLMWKEALLSEGWEEDLPNPLSLLRGDCWRMQFDGRERERIRQLYAVINEELTGRGPGYASVVQGAIRELLIRCYRAHEASALSGDIAAPNDLPEEIAYLVQYISANFQHELSLDKLSKLVHMNPSYVSNIFHRYTGTTLTKLITVKRLHHAKKLLRETKLPVTDIAYQCGFNNHSYFIKLFKRMENYSPLHYRRQHQPLEADVQSSLPSDWNLTK